MTTYLVRYFLILLFLALPAAAQDDYQARWSRWHQERIEVLKQPDGWLSMAGFWWLQEGETYSIGSEPSSRIRFPKGPGQIGQLDLKAGPAKVDIAEGAEIKKDGQLVRQWVFHEGAPETPFTWGTLQWFVVKRLGRYALRLKDSQNPGLLSFKDIPTYPVDPAWRVQARFARHPAPVKLDVPLGKEFSTMEECPGLVHFELGGKSHRLHALTERGRTQLCIIFGDSTNGGETYGGGRYVYIDPPGLDGTVELDFNRSINPPCALTQHTTCSRPRAEDILDVPVRAGEKNPLP